MGKSVSPNSRANLLPASTKHVVVIVIVGTPDFSRAILSWKLHEVLPAQSAMPFITASHFTRSPMVSPGTPRAGVCLRNLKNLAILNCSASNS